MKIKLFGLTLSSIFALANAKQHYFNVVSINNDEYSLGVKINGQVSNFTSKYFPLFTGTVNVDKVDKYKYVLLNRSGSVVEEESFERTYSEENSNKNEVYNRTNKKVEVPKLPEPLKISFPMGTEKYEPFPKNEIYNVFAKCNEDQYNDRKNNPFLEGKQRNDELVNCTISIVTPEKVYQSNGNIHLSGYGSRLYKKLSWVIKLDNKFMGRNTIKIRAVANDATLMRDKLTADLYRAMGVPVQEGTYARVIINKDVWGLYTIVDNHNKKWYANYIHGNNKSRVGTSYKMVSSHPVGPFADLKYLGDDPLNYSGAGSYGVDEVDEADPEANALDTSTKWNRLIKFVKLFDEWNKKYQNDNSDAAIEALNKFLDVEQTLRMMAVDALTMGYDNFWYVQSNTLIYYNPQADKYQFIPYDFDEALKGRNDLFDFEVVKDDCLTWANIPETGSDQYFTKAILAHPQIKARYDVVLAAASRRLFTVDSVSPYIDAISNLIKEDVEWNFNLANNYTSSYDGLVNHFTLKNFNDATNIGKVPYDRDVTPDEVVYGLKRYIQMRGDGCRAYTKDVVVPVEEINSANHFTSTATIIFVLFQIFIYFI
ncbi:hypothetical protein H8356DRAFT_1704236 [Neocallimastix lanati (nom. inval.)]|jgi:hypothetical protein|nr:hypothetical protein H8356DRAFT_1704236 [Neocallimastix sp. JGI-2020a]